MFRIDMIDFPLTISASIKKSEGVDEVEEAKPIKKKKKKKQPNPLSCKKKKKKAPTSSDSALHSIKEKAIAKKTRKRVKIPTHVKQMLQSTET